jgi:hypothetical protein
MTPASHPFAVRLGAARVRPWLQRFNTQGNQNCLRAEWLLTRQVCTAFQSCR